MYTYWLCEKCNRRGKTMHPVGAGISEVVNMISDSHNLLSPQCSFDVYKVKVLASDRFDTERLK